MLKQYDVIIIGGGIQGAGIAQAFALNGRSVLLLEQYTIASQTSSRSSKLIHGGLRYLESFQFSLVKECLTERNILLKIAPDLVKMVRFYIPVYQASSRSRFKIKFGLFLYSLLGGFKRETRFITVCPSEWSTLDGLKLSGLKAVYQYYDAQTDDRLLTLAVLNSAFEYGARYLEAAKFEKANIRDEFCDIEYRYQSVIHRVSAKLLVNAAGPWASQIIDKITPKQKNFSSELVQGAHIELDRQFSKGIYYIESPLDQRALFVMPRESGLLVGTTEKIFQGDPDDVSIGQDEISYLQESVAEYFPQLAQSKIVKFYAGLRVLPSSDKSPFSRSRETQIEVDNKKSPRFISVIGGKLTAYRHTAEKVYKRTESLFSDRKKYVSSKNILLKKPKH